MWHVKKLALLYVGLGALVAAVIIGALFLYTNVINDEKVSTSAGTDQTATPIMTSTDDLFSLSADKQDTIGVDLNSTFTLTSEEAIDVETVTSHLAVTPKLTYKVESSDSNTFSIIPQEQLKTNTVYTFKLATQADESSKKREYSWAYQTKDTFKITGTLPADKATRVPVNTGIEITFSHDTYTDYEQYIEISPYVSGTFEKYRKTLVFAPEAMLPSTVYTVTVHDGLPVSGSDEALHDEYVFRFETAPEDESIGLIAFDNQFFEYPVAEVPVLTLHEYDTGLTNVTVNVWAFNTFDEFTDAVSNIDSTPFWAYYARTNTPYPTDSLPLHSTFNADIQEADYQKYIEFPEGVPQGSYLVDITYSIGGNEKHTQTFLQSSNLVASFQGSQSASLIWVHDVTDASAAESALILFSGNQQFSAETNSNGISSFDTPIELSAADDDQPNQTYHFTVQSGSNQLLIPVARHYERSWWFSSSASEDYWSYLYTNRNLYLPTDSIKFWGIAKKRNSSNVNEITIELTSSRYYSSSGSEIIDSVTLPISNFGTFEGSFDISNLNPGSYVIEATAGGSKITSSYINVQTYTKPPYKIEVTTPRRAIFEGENAVFDITSSFFDGTPVANLELSYSGTFGSGVVTTDANGTAQVSLATTYSNSGYYPSYSYFSVHPTQTEVTNIYSEAYVYTFGPRYGIEVQSEEPTSITGNVHNITLDRMNADSDDFRWDYEGDPINGATVDLLIYHTYYEKIETGTRYDFINKKTYKTYRYDLHEDLVTETLVTTTTDGTFTFPFEPTEEWRYKVVADVADPDGRIATDTTYFSTGNSSYYSGYYEGFDSYHITTDKDDLEESNVYSIGDQVTASFYKNDSLLEPDMNGSIVFFKDHNSIFDVTHSTDPVLQFNFSDTYVPNVYVYGIYFNGRSYQLTPAKRVSFDRDQRKLSITVSQNKDTYLPGETATLSINVTDSSDQPVVAEVNVSAIDEALAAIQWGSTVSTLSTLYRYIQPSLTLSYSTHKEAMAPMAEGGGCFTGDTLILMSDGSTKSIRDVEVGDSVATLKTVHDSSLVSTTVTATAEHTISHYLTINGALNVTPEHIILINREWRPAGTAHVGDTLTNELGKTVTIRSIIDHHNPTVVYNLSTDTYHTFIADGFYVHNEKGGGRENFQDVAYFGSVTTNEQGNASVQIDLPDNITSWLTTVQAVTTNLEAAGEQTSVIVTQPFFVDISMAEEYLTDDQPIVKLRTFGSALNIGDSVSYKISFLETDFASIQQQGNAYEPIEIVLPNLEEGTYKIQVHAESGVYEDTIAKSVAVLQTHLTEQKILHYLIDESLTLAETNDRHAVLTFSNKERGQYYNQLRHLRWFHGDRLDQKMARHYSQVLLNEYYDDTRTPEDITFSDFQEYDGGIAILPYASSEILFTAKILEIAPDLFDTDAAAAYLYNILDSRTSTPSEITYALFGLTNIGEPVLTDIISFMGSGDLDPELKLYLARGLANLGAGEYAGSILSELMSLYGEETGAYTRLTLGEIQDDVTEYTYQAAIIAAGISSPQADKLFAYARANRAKFQLNTLEELAYLSKTLPLLSGEPVSFSYTVDGSREDVSLEGNQIHKKTLIAAQVESISFSNIVGAVGLIVEYAVPIDPSTATTDDNLTIERSYSVNGTDTVSFNENDVVKVAITPTADVNAIDRDYAVTDYLPSGLKLLSNLNAYDIDYERGLRYPYEINGQAVKFWAGKSSKTFFYYATVIGKGTYVAEPTVYQGIIVPESKTYGTQQILTIE